MGEPLSQLWTVVVSGLVLTTPVVNASLMPLLDALGKEERRRETEPCAIKELTVIEELDGEGNGKGKVIREYAVIPGKGAPIRTFVSQRIEGNPGSMFRDKPKEVSPDPGPFHPAIREMYRISLNEAARTLHFEPKQNHEKRVRGTALVDIEKRQVLSMTTEPTAYPMFLNELKLKHTFGATACGWQPTRVTTQGEGGFLFIRARFRTVTTLSDHTPGAR